MDIKRLSKLLAARWWVIVLVTLAGVIVGLFVPGSASPVSSALLGGLIAAVLAVVAILRRDRHGKHVLGVETDLTLPILATVAPRRLGNNTGGSWYLSVDQRRYGDIESLREALDGIMTGSPISIGLIGWDVGSATVHELAGDLAATIASAGHETLLIDAIFEDPATLIEYSTTGVTVADIVANPPPAATARDDLKRLLDGQVVVMPRLVGMRAGRTASDPVDAVTSTGFRDLLDVAFEYAEVTVIAAGHWGDPGIDILLRRFDCVLLASRIGVAPRDDIEDAARQLVGRAVRFGGLVLLAPRNLGPTDVAALLRTVGRKVRASIQPRSAGTAKAGSAAEVPATGLTWQQPTANEAMDPEPPSVPRSPVITPPLLPPADARSERTRLQRERRRGRGRRRTGKARPPAVPLAELASRLPQDDSFVDPDFAFHTGHGLEIGEVLLAQHLQDLLRHGIDRPAIPDHPAGTLLLIPERTAEPGAAVLYTQVFTTGPPRTDDLNASLRRVLGVEPTGATRDEVVVAIDWWLRRRLADIQPRLGDEVMAWQLSSRLGTLQMLVNARTFDTTRAADLHSATRATLERLNAELKRQIESGSNRIARTRSQIVDVEDFDRALEQLSQVEAGTALSQRQLDDVDLLAPAYRVGVYGSSGE